MEIGESGGIPRHLKILKNSTSSTSSTSSTICTLFVGTFSRGERLRRSSLVCGSALSGQRGIRRQPWLENLRNMRDMRDMRDMTPWWDFDNSDMFLMFLSLFLSFLMSGLVLAFALRVDFWAIDWLQSRTDWAGVPEAGPHYRCFGSPSARRSQPLWHQRQFCIFYRFLLSWDSWKILQFLSATLLRHV